MRRHLCALLLPAVLILVQPLPAYADDSQVVRTNIDSVTPLTTGLTITGTPGGCDLLLDNNTGLDVQFFDLRTPAKPLLLKARPKSIQVPTPIPVHFGPENGVWPCATVPAINEDMRWNHQSVNLLTWSLKGQVGTTAFVMKAHTAYDPTLDPVSEWMQYLRIGGAFGLALALILFVPWLLRSRREILGPRPRRRTA